jgi:hypothetical protein
LRLHDLAAAADGSLERSMGSNPPGCDAKEAVGRQIGDSGDAKTGKKGLKLLSRRIKM